MFRASIQVVGLAVYQLLTCSLKPLVLIAMRKEFLSQLFTCGSDKICPIDKIESTVGSKGSKRSLSICRAYVFELDHLLACCG